VRSPGHPKREQTNESLRVERDKSDVAIANERAAIDEKADDVVRIARQRADRVVETARDDAKDEHRPQSAATEASSKSARTALEHERSDADAALEQERAERRRYRADVLGGERDKADGADAKKHEAVEQEANEVVRVARQRADQVVQTARDYAARQSTATEDNSERARTVLEHERSDADAVLKKERAQRRRDRTDVLAGERDRADGAEARKHEAVEQEADEVVRVARQRADQVVQTARDYAARQSTATEADSERARTALEHERSYADRVLAQERTERRRDRPDFLAIERDTTDKDLVGERAHADTLIVDQREANEQMLRATIRAQELSVEADEAKERAEESERKLREVAEFREMFIGVLGHDLRNPLGSIVMAATLLLRRGNLDEQDSETVARIIRSNQRMSRMITQLLDLTRARLGGGLPIEAEATDLREICKNVVEEFEATTILLKVEGDVTGTWDGDRLAEALSNLAGNAIDYAAPGTVVIVKALADGAEVVVEISNQGNPIPPDVLPFIFEPFRRAKQHEKSATGKLGLGLYIAHQIVLSHGGTLVAHSADRTTTFAMRLPRRPPPPGSIQRIEIDGTAKA
jgi:signal transduction histidine kinase